MKKILVIVVSVVLMFAGCLSNKPRRSEEPVIHPSCIEIPTYTMVLGEATSPSSRQYAIFDYVRFGQVAATGGIDIAEFQERIAETSVNTLRKSLDEKWAICKTGVETNALYLRNKAAELGISYTEYDHDGILSVLGGTNWASGGQ